MNEANDILTLIGIPNDKIQSFSCDYQENIATIYLELKDIRGCCPKCGSIEIGIKDYYDVYINNSIIKHKNYQIHLRVRRYICKKCHSSFKQDYHLYENRNSISLAVKQSIIDDLKERLTFVQIAKDHNVSPKTVRNIFDKAILPQLPLPLSEIICIDEFCFKHNKKEGKYPAVITDPMSGKIIDIIESRWKTVLIDYFNKVKVTYRHNVKYFVSDMNDTYRDIKRIFFKDAIHIADRFHIIKAFNDAITKIRTRIIKQEVWEDSEYRYLKKNWKIFLKDRNELKKKEL